MDPDKLMKRMFGIEIGPNGIHMIGPDDDPLDMDENRNPKMSELYGVKTEEYDMMVKEILADLIRYEKKGAIDKHFKELDEQGRCRVIAFCNAMKLMEKAHEVWGKR